MKIQKPKQSDALIGRLISQGKSLKEAYKIATKCNK